MRLPNWMNSLTRILLSLALAAGLAPGTASAAAAGRPQSSVGLEPEVVAEPVSVWRVQSSHAAGNVVVTYTVSNNLPPAHLPVLPAGGTVTDTIDTLAAFSETLDINTLRNVGLATDLEAGVSLVDATPGVGQTGNSLTWSLGDLAPMARAVITATLQTPAQGADFVELDSGAQVTAVRWGEVVGAAARPAALAPAGLDPAHTAATVEADTNDSDMLWRAAGFGQDPLAAFEYVQGLGYDPYYGSLRGTRGTLWGRAGNALDKASLLIAMLRAAGVPARYRHGTLALGEAQALIDGMFPAAAGVAGNLPAGTALADPRNDAELIGLVEDHWWVEAYLPGTGWEDLDPSFGDTVPGDVRATPAGDGTDRVAGVPASFQHRVTLSLEVERYSQFPSGDGPLTRSFTLTETMPVAKLASRPLSVGHLVETEVQGGGPYTNVSHTYTPYFSVLGSDEYTLGTAFQDFLSNFPLASSFTTAAWLHVEVVDAQGQRETFTREIKDVVGLEARLGGGNVTLTTPVDNAAFFGVGDVYVLWFLPNSTSDETLSRRQREGLFAAGLHFAREAQPALELFAVTNPTPEEFERLRDATLAFQATQAAFHAVEGLEFAGMADQTAAQLERGLRVKLYYDQPRVIGLSTQYDAATETVIKAIDLRTTHARTLVYPGQSVQAGFTANWLKGVSESYQEGRALARTTGVEPVTTARVFDEMTAQSIAPVWVTPETADLLSLYQLDPAATAYAEQALMEGKNILIPSQPVLVEGEERLGWWEVDPTTGETIGVMENGLHISALEWTAISIGFGFPFLLNDVWGLRGAVVEVWDYVVCHVVPALGGTAPNATGDECTLESPFGLPWPIPTPPPTGHGAALARTAATTAGAWMDLPAHLCPVDECGVERFVLGAARSGPIPLPDLLFVYADEFVAQPRVEQVMATATNGAGGAAALTLATTPGSSSIAAGGTASFEVDLEANFTEEAAVNVYAPPGWFVTFSDDDTVAVTTPPGTAPGVYTVAVTAQPVSTAGATDTAEHTVTVAATGALSLEVTGEEELTVPAGTAVFAAASGQTNDGEAEIGDSAYVIALDNPTGATLSLEVAVSGAPPGWLVVDGATQDSTSVTLEAGESTRIGLYVVAPPGAVPAAGTHYNLQVAVSESGAPAASEGVVWTLPAQAFNYVTAAPGTLYLGASSSVDITVTSTGVGNDTGDFPISASLPPGVGGISGLTSALGLAPGAAQTITATLTTTGAPAGARIPIWLASAAPNSYTQYAGVEALIVSMVSEPVFEAAATARTECPLAEPGLSAALEALGLAMIDLENDCADGTCGTSAREAVMEAAELAALYARAAWPGLTADEGLEAAAAPLATHTTEAEVAIDLGNISSAVVELQAEVCVVDKHRMEARWTPGYGATLLGQPLTYTLEVTNQGSLTTTYVVTASLPAGSETFSVELPPGEGVSTPYSVTAGTLGLYTLSAEAAAQGLPLQTTATARVNVVDQFVQLTQVVVDPAFVDTGTSATALSIEVANSANLAQAVTAHAVIEAPTGAVSHTSDLALDILAGAPRTYALETVDTSGWAEGVYTVTVDLLDGEGSLVPDGHNFTYLWVGPSLAASHSVTPETAAPGTFTVTTVITSELLAPGGTAAATSGPMSGAVGAPAWGAVWLTEAEATNTTETNAPSGGLAPAGPALVTAGDAVSRTESTSGTITFSGSWGSVATGVGSGGSMHRSGVAGSTATLAFSGPWVNVGFQGSPSSGYAEVFIDGVSQGTLDLYRNDGLSIEQVYAGLADTNHVVSVTVVGARNGFSSGNNVDLDYIDTWDGTAAPEGVFEQDSARVFRTLGWSTSGNAAASGGSYSTFSGGSAWFLFVGDTVTYQGFAFASAGVARLYVDGEYKASLNLYGPTNAPRTLSLEGLGAGAHVLRVDAHYGQVTVDAFSTPGTGPFYTPPSVESYHRFEEDDPALLFNGLPYELTRNTWDTPLIGLTPVASEQNARTSITAGDNVSLTFDGSWASVGFVAHTQGGMAEVFVDGVSYGQVGTYSAANDVRRLVISDLVTGTHTLSVTVLGTPHAPSTQSRIYLDYIEVWDGTLLPDDLANADLIERNERLSYGGRLAQVSHANALQGDYVGMGLGGAAVDTNIWYAFTGDSFTFYAFSRNLSPAVVELRVDEGLTETIDFYYPFSHQPIAYHFNGYGPGLHVVRLSNVNYLQVDGFASNPAALVGHAPLAEWWDNTQAGGSIWGGIVTPIAAGDINDDGVVELVAASSDIAHSGSLAAYRGDGGDSGDGDPVVWQVNYDIFNGFEDVGAPAIGDLDGEPGAEIVLATIEGVYAYHADGTLYWYTDTLQAHVFFGTPAIGNLDAEPLPEIVVNLDSTLAVLEHDGTLAWSTVSADDYFNPVLADLTGDGLLDILINNGDQELFLWDYNLGAPQLAWTAVFTRPMAVYGGPAVADLDGHLPGGDAGPEIGVMTDDFLHVLDADGSVVWSKGLTPGRGGAVSVGDLDGDGVMELLASTESSGAWLYAVEADGSMLWSTAVGDNSPANASLMDLEGDGAYEVAWVGPDGFHLFSGVDGSLLFVEPLVTSRTGSDFPIFADVDQDGYGEVVVPAQGGLRVFGHDGVWGPARPLWNQPSYHITNVQDDLSIPLNETRSWETHNTFRTQTPEQAPVPPAYLITAAHTVGVNGQWVLTDTFNAAPDTAADPRYGWTYTQSADNAVVTRTFQSRLTGLAPGETRQTAQDTMVTYTLPSGSDVLTLPPLFVTAARLIEVAPAQQAGNAGVTLPYTLTLTNPTSEAMSYTLEVAGLPAGWATAPDPVMVAADSKLTIVLPITMTVDATPAEYSFSVKATTDQGYEDAATAGLEVTPALVQVDIEPSEQAGPAGTPVAYTLVITNLANAPRTYALTAFGLPEVTVPAQVVVDAVSSLPVTMTVEAGGPGPQPFTVEARTVEEGGYGADTAVVVGEGFALVSVDLTPSSVSTGPGMTADFNVQLNNRVNETAAYDLSVQTPVGWTAELTWLGTPVDMVVLGPGQAGTMELGLRVTPPAGAAPGAYGFSVTATAQGGAGAQAAVDGQVVVEGPGVDVTFEGGPTTLAPTEAGHWEVRITNTGDQADSYELNVFGPLAPLANWPSATAVLDPGESEVVEVTTLPALFGLPGQAYPLGMAAQSLTHDPVNDQAALEVTFEPYHGLEVRWEPGPQSARPDEAAHYSLVVVNHGNVPATLQLTLTPSGAAEASLPLAGVTVPAHGSVVQLVSALAGQPGMYTLTAEADDGVAQAEAGTTLEVLAPGLFYLYVPFAASYQQTIYTDYVYVPVVRGGGT